MSTDAPAQRFVDEVISEIIEPGVERLLESRYFADLRAGTLTKRRMQGFAIQHYRHNMAILKGFALLAVQAAPPQRPLPRLRGRAERGDHPPGHVQEIRVCARALRRRLRERAAHLRLPRAHGRMPGTTCTSRRPPRCAPTPLSNETMVQRYSTEFDAHLRSYGVPDEAMEFFIVHMGADVEHTERAANAIAQLAVTDEEQERVRAVCRNMARFKLGKFESIYDEYA